MGGRLNQNMNSFGKIIRLVLALALAIALAYGFTNIAKGSTTLSESVFEVYPSAGMLMLIFGTALLFPVLYILLRMSLWGTLIIIVLLVVGINFLFKSYSLSGVAVGKFKGDRTVYGVAKPIIFFRPITKGDVVVFKQSGVIDDSVVAYVIGGPGDMIDVTSNLSGIDASDRLLSGYYLVEFGEEKEQQIITELQITYLVWYPLKW